MARSPRPDLVDVAQHIVQRGNNRGACFFDDSDRLYYLGLLGEAARELDIAVHAYALMSNHVHLLGTARQPGGISALMQRVGRRYVPWVNKRHERTGGLYEGRFKGRLVHTERYLLCCYRYIELNPVRAGLAPDPGAYPWSSFRCNAMGESDNLITLHPVFAELGLTPEERRQRYRDFVAEGIPGEELEAIRAHLTPRRGRPKREKGSDDFS
jgi:putative transposase